MKFYYLRSSKAIWSIILITFMLTCVGCGRADPKSSAHFVIGVSQCNLGEPWRVQMNADIKAAAAKHPEIQLLLTDAQNDTLRQCGQVDELVSSKVNLIIISPKEAQPLTEPVARAMAAGIPVIVLDRHVVGENYSCFIGADNKQIGKAAGEWVVQHLHGTGKIVELMGLQTSSPGQERHSGFLEGIASSKVEVVFSADMKWLESNARNEMESALARCQKIDLVFAHNDDGAHGAYLAAKAAGREKGIQFVGIDALPQEGLAYVRQGILNATFQYPTGGAEAIEVALRILQGEKVPKSMALKSRLFEKNAVTEGGFEVNR